MNEFITFLEQYQLIAGGLLVTVGGVALNYARSLPNAVLKFLRKLLLVSVTVEERDYAFSWVQSWLHANFEPRRDFMVHSGESNNQPREESNDRAKSGKPQYIKTPAPGSHFGWFQGVPMWIVFNKTIVKPGDDMLSALKGSTYTITFMTRDKLIVDRFIQDCLKESKPSDNKVRVEVPSYGRWSETARIRKRSIDSVYTGKNEHVSMLEDVRNFIASEDWYIRTGVPYRRGYLLYGPPGNGKSSIVTAVASELDMTIKVLNLGDSTLTNDGFASLIGSAGKHSIVLMEDVDSAFSKESKLTLSSVLNALDGTLSGEGRVVVMTTNHLDKLEEEYPALVRSGRVDYRLYIDNASIEQIREMHDKFYPEGDFEKFAEALTEPPYSMSQIQEKLVRLRM